MKKSYDVAIIGAGICGLTTAYRLSKKGFSVLLIEKNGQPGGLLKSIRQAEYKIEEYYHHIIQSDRETIELIDELSLKKKFRFYPSRSSFLFKDFIFELSTPLDLFKFRGLGLIDKLRWGSFLAKVLLIRNYENFDNITAKKFIIDNAGKNVYEKFFREMLIGKFGDKYHNISAAWFIARLKFRASRKNGYEMLGYLENGFGTLVEALTSQTEGKIDMLLNSSVENISIKSGTVESITVKGKQIKVKHLVSTISVSEIYNKTKLIELKKSTELEEQGAIVVVIGTKKKVTDHYWNTIEIPFKTVRAVIEHTNLVPDYPEKIVYLMSYPNLKSRLWSISDKDVLKAYLNDIKDHSEILMKEIKWYKVIRSRSAGLVYNKGILALLRSLKPQVENLHLAGMLTQFPERSINHSIIQADEISRKIIQEAE